MPRRDTRTGSNCWDIQRLRYPSRVIPVVKTDATVVHSARLGAWSQGCDEQITGDAWRSRMREWLMMATLRRYVLDLCPKEIATMPRRPKPTPEIGRAHV